MQALLGGKRSCSRANVGLQITALVRPAEAAALVFSDSGRYESAVVYCVRSGVPQERDGQTYAHSHPQP